jgi:hypothetical protein
MGDESTRWTIVIDKETDIDVRTHLAEQGMKKGDLSKFVKEAVRWQLLRESLADVREGFKDMQPDELQALVDEALAAVRANPDAYDSDT